MFIVIVLGAAFSKNASSPLSVDKIVFEVDTTNAAVIVEPTTEVESD